MPGACDGPMPVWKEWQPLQKIYIFSLEIFRMERRSVPFTVGVHRLACSCGGGYTAVGLFRLVRGFLLSRARKFTRPSITLVNFCDM